MIAHPTCQLCGHEHSILVACGEDGRKPHGFRDVDHEVTRKPEPSKTTQAMIEQLAVPHHV